jgi:hypothetical protein
LRLLFGGMLAHAPFLMASSLIHPASYPRSASDIDPDFRRAKSLPASRLSWASPGVSASRTGRPVGIYNCMNLAGQPAPRPSHRLPPIPCDARTMLMHADNGGVDHPDSRIMGSGECIYDTAPDTGPPPANEAIVAGGV